MNVWQSSAAALLFLTGVVNANAATYTLTFSGASHDFNPVPDGMSEATQTFGATLTLETIAPIIAPFTTAGASCSLNGPASAYLSCGDSHEFDPNGFNTGFNFIGFQYGESADLNGNLGYLWFAPGSFTTEGTHEIYTGAISNGNSNYGNFASAGTLVVSGVPELHTALMMLAGLGVVGGVARRRDCFPKAHVSHFPL